MPRLDTAEQVREAVTFLRYPPTGQRGVALLTRGARLGTVNHAGVAALNDDIVGIVQIESPSALQAADDFAATDGVDVLFVGPADLSHSLGIPGQFSNPIYQDALKQVVAACRAHGKAAGILLYDHASFKPAPRSRLHVRRDRRGRVVRERRRQGGPRRRARPLEPRAPG